MKLRYVLRSELPLEEQKYKRKMDREVYHVKRKDKPSYKQAKRKTYEKYKEVNKSKLRNFTLKRKYGITLEVYQILFEQQNGVCAICKRSEERRTLAVDHNHKTGKVRGLLCGSCNRALGLFNDDPEILATAREYVL